MFKWIKSLFKGTSSISKSVQFSLGIIKLFEQYEISDPNTKDAVIDTIVAVLNQHKSPAQPVTTSQGS
jgi:hypothetical protein